MGKHGLVQRLRKNLGGYHGDRIRVSEILTAIRRIAPNNGWTVEPFEAGPNLEIIGMRRIAENVAGSLQDRRRIYISTGIHGDEPAGPSAMLQLIEENRWPEGLDVWLIPCLNPSGFDLNTRENSNGIDLNRDYLQQMSAEVRSHIAWMERQPRFDLSLCLHEDWESNGFYVYELNPEGRPSLAASIVSAVAEVCPIDDGELIDGRKSAAPGIIRPDIDPRNRPQWPEAFYLITYKTRLSYTFEAPSDFPLETRIRALVTGVRTVLNGIFNTDSHSAP
jgi:protein MpaA